VLTVHVKLNANTPLEDQKNLKRRLSQELSDFDLSHTTVEIELDDEHCRDQ